MLFVVLCICFIDLHTSIPDVTQRTAQRHSGSNGKWGLDTVHGILSPVNTQVKGKGTLARCSSTSSINAISAIIWTRKRLQQPCLMMRIEACQASMRIISADHVCAQNCSMCQCKTTPCIPCVYTITLACHQPSIGSGGIDTVLVFLDDEYRTCKISISSRQPASLVIQC